LVLRSYTVTRKCPGVFVRFVHTSIRDIRLCDFSILILLLGLKLSGTGLNWKNTKPLLQSIK
jgi:hypothetical protein